MRTRCLCSHATHLILALLAATSPAAAQDQKPEEPKETNWASLIKDTGRDFASFPQRKSTWVFLAAGGALALAVHPADDYVEAHIVGNTAADRFFAPGKVLGSAPFQVGSALTLYLVGRHLTKDEPRTHRLPTSPST